MPSSPGTWMLLHISKMFFSVLVPLAPSGEGGKPRHLCRIEPVAAAVGEANVLVHPIWAWGKGRAFPASELKEREHSTPHITLNPSQHYPCAGGEGRDLSWEFRQLQTGMQWAQSLFYRQKGPGGPAFRAVSSMSSIVQDELNKVAHWRVNQADLGMGAGQKSMVNHKPNFPKGNV